MSETMFPMAFPGEKRVMLATALEARLQQIDEERSRVASLLAEVRNGVAKPDVAPVRRRRGGAKRGRAASGTVRAAILKVLGRSVTGGMTAQQVKRDLTREGYNTESVASTLSALALAGRLTRTGTSRRYVYTSMGPARG